MSPGLKEWSDAENERVRVEVVANQVIQLSFTEFERQQVGAVARGAGSLSSIGHPETQPGTVGVDPAGNRQNGVFLIPRAAAPQQAKKPHAGVWEGAF